MNGFFSFVRNLRHPGSRLATLMASFCVGCLATIAAESTNDLSATNEAPLIDELSVTNEAVAKPEGKPNAPVSNRTGSNRRRSLPSSADRNADESTRGTNLTAAPAQSGARDSESRRARNRASRTETSEESATPAQGRDFQAFKIVYERNIFDPNRRPLSARRSERESAKPARIDGFSLIGTLIYDEGSYAFFDGTETKFRTVLTLSNSIAGFKLVQIDPNCVRLSSSSNTLELPMGMQMKKQDEGTWQLVTGSGSWAAQSATTNETEKPAEAGSSSDSAGDDVLKRLMQKREQELKK